ncbi:hypothetical protein CAG99_19395 [Streptomyces marincola]|uniref:Uncharacterized protein n=1 Tax=Streptomyces marincola TaxID=2878388 RepID=A0A1W7D0W3_9ACTN|nr:hypothetical protein CAG99_19395 [Streptomyces marincola]
MSFSPRGSDRRGGPGRAVRGGVGGLAPVGGREAGGRPEGARRCHGGCAAGGTGVPGNGRARPPRGR